MNKYIVRRHGHVAYSAVIEAESEEEAEEISELMDAEQFKCDDSLDFCEVDLINEQTCSWEYKILPVIPYGSVSADIDDDE